HAVAIPGGNFCTFLSIPRYIYAFWIPTFVFECFLCTLAIMRGLRHFSFRGSYYSTSVNLVNILVQDSILYFIAQVTGATYLICMVIWIVDLESFDAPVGFSIAMSSTLCSRMVLKVHGMYADDSDRELRG
ncbi:hypothetical protein CVT25_000297, partial [Psilocybe cyanescens]